MSSLIIRAAESDEERRLGKALMSHAHHDDDAQARRWRETAATAAPDYQRNHTRIALCGDELAAAMQLTPHTIRLGEARLKTAGFGWLSIAERHRHKGIATVLIGDTFQYMRQQNYHIAMLFGLPNFYKRFGFTANITHTQYALSAREAATTPSPPYKTRTGKPGDIRKIQKLHNIHENNIDCSIVRSAAHLASNWERWKSVQVLTNQHGNIFAYFLPNTDNQHLQIDEIGLNETSEAPALLHACATAALNANYPRIQFSLPTPHPFTNYLKENQCPYQQSQTQYPDGMMAFVNLSESLETMLPEWEQSLRNSTEHDTSTEITLLIDKQPHRIRANHGALDIAPAQGINKLTLTTPDLMQLLTGTLPLQSILNQQHRILTKEAKKLLATIFPPRTPFIWPTDHF